MHKPFLAIFLFFVALTFAKAQDTVCLKKQAQKNTTITDRPPQAVYVELGGNGVGLSANYDRRFNKKTAGLGFRAGIGYSFTTDVNFVSIPVGINYLAGSKGHYFEAGVGETLLFVNSHASDSYDFFGDDFSRHSSILFTAVNIGYRRQPVNGGFNFRAGVMPVFIEGTAGISGYISFGYNF